MTRLLLLALLLPTLALGGQLTLVDWNILNFPGSYGPTRAPYFQTALDAMDPDIIVAQEIIGSNGVTTFMSLILDPLHPDEWEVGPWHDSYDTDRGIFIRNECVEVVNSGWLDTALRDIEWWDLAVPESADTFRIYTLHLKASSGSSEELQRYNECLILRANLDALPSDYPYIVAGDYNIYHSTEDAFELLMSAGAGQLHDPIDRIGYWHNNSSFADIHTQCPRLDPFQGGSSGGMDDRFDMILVSEHWMDGTALEILPETYTAFANDGEHYNTSIIAGGFNNAVPFEVAEAVYYSSDHVPLVVELSFEEPTDSPDLPGLSLPISAWPNPFNPTVSLNFELEKDAQVNLDIFDLSGRRVASLIDAYQDAGSRNLTWRAAGLPSGVYMARLLLNGRLVDSEKLVLLR
jgi:endonuclease/exonuclease/phosphatase family metal-dependent hydrolase